MSILVTGATGTIGSQVVKLLAERGADVRAFARNPEKASFPQGVKVAKGDLMNVDSVRAALAGTRTMFLLNAVTSDELTQALIALNVACEAGVERIVYFSVIHSDRYVNVPHFAGKYTAEQMIREMRLPATILRPAYFMDNDLGLKDAIAGAGLYPMPIGSKGLAMVSAADIAEIAALELLRRERSAEPAAAALDRRRWARRPHRDVGSRDLVGSARPQCRLWRERHRRLRARGQGPRARLDGLRHEGDGRPVPDRRHAARRGRRRPPRRHARSPAQALSRLRGRDRSTLAVLKKRYFASPSISAFSVPTVDTSASPSMRSGRKWRWKASTTARVRRS